MARKRLKVAASAMKNHNAEQFYDEVLKALWGYMSYKLNIDRAEFGDDRFESFFDCVVIGDIAFICAALYTARLDRCFAFLGGAVV